MSTQPITMQESLDKLNGFLEGVRKEAAEEPNNTSFMATPAATPAAASQDAPSNDSPEGSAVSKEKTQEAEATGSTVDTVPENKDGDVPAAAVPETNQDTNQMDADTPVTGSGQMGSVTVQEITQEQKVASLHRTIGIVTENLKNIMAKEAAEGEAETLEGAAEPPKVEGEGTKKSDSTNGPEPTEEGETPAKDDGGVDAALEKLQAELGGAPADPFAELEKWANEAAVDFRDDLVRGALLRVQDEISLKEAMELENFPKDAREAIEQLGGPSEFLTKVAMENPESILPAEVAAEEAPEGMPAEGELPAEGGMPAMPAEGELPMEGMPAEGEVTEEDIAAIEQLLAEAGVTEEDLMAAQGDLDELAQAGASPEEAASAMDAMASEEMGEKVASSENPRVQGCIDFLRSRQNDRKASK